MRYKIRIRHKFDYYDLYKDLTNIAVSKIGSASVGLVKLNGIAWYEKPVLTPDQTPAAYYARYIDKINKEGFVDWHIEEQGSKSIHFNRVQSEVLTKAFYVFDKTGFVKIFAKNIDNKMIMPKVSYFDNLEEIQNYIKTGKMPVKIIWHQFRDFTDNNPMRCYSYRVTEYIIPLGKILLLYGNFVPSSSLEFIEKNKLIIALEKMLCPILENKSLAMKYFDKNKNNSIETDDLSLAGNHLFKNINLIENVYSENGDLSSRQYGEILPPSKDQSLYMFPIVDGIEVDALKQKKIINNITLIILIGAFLLLFGFAREIDNYILKHPELKNESFGYVSVQTTKNFIRSANSFSFSELIEEHIYKKIEIFID